MAIQLIHKNSLFAALALCVFFLPSFAHALIIKPANNLGLAAYWSLDEGTSTTAGDHSGHGNKGTFVNTPLWTSGKLHEALQFNGSNNYISRTSPTGLNTGATARSMSAWIKINTGGTTMVPFVFGACTPNGAAFGVYVDSGNDLHFWGCGDDFDASYTLKPGTWYHIAITTVSGATVAVYVNGVLVTTGTPTSGSTPTNLTSPSVTTYLNAGSAVNVDPGNYYFNGAVDELRYYNRTLSATEVAYLYKTSSTLAHAVPENATNPLSGSLTASWSFDTATVSGTTVADQSGNGHNLTLVNGASIVTGHSGQALSLNGSNQYAVGFIGNLPTSVALSMWVQPNDVSTEQSVLVEQDSTTPNSGYHFTLVGIRSGAFYAGFWNIGDIASSPLVVGQWYHVILTYDGVANTQSLYVNNVLQGTQSGTWSPPSQIYFFPGLQQQSCSFTNTSGHCADLAHYFNGQIDDLQAYDQAFSASDVASLSSSNVFKIGSGAELQNGTTLGNGLVGYWSFDGADITDKIYDRFGGNSGYVAPGGPATSSMKVAGKFGQALTFNGSDDIAIPTGTNVPVGNSTYTLSAWIEPTSLGGLGGIIGWGNYGTSNQVNAFRLTSSSECSGGQGLWNYWWANDLKACTALLTVNAWHFVVAEFDGTTRKIYVDDSLIASDTPGSSHNVPDTSSFKIGQTCPVSVCSGNGGEYFNGKLDDMRIYNRALSDAEIKQLYNLGR